MAKQVTKIDINKIKEIYKKVGTPGEHHKLLAKLEGSWITRSKSWTAPDKPSVESIGTSEQKLILDGHYLQQVYSGDMMGKPYAGISLLGYNNHAKKYESIWIDSMNTAILFFEGTASKDGKTITQECRYDDPVRGPSIWRTVTRFRDDNTQVFEMFLTPRGRKEEKMMEMTITRKEAIAGKAA